MLLDLEALIYEEAPAGGETAVSRSVGIPWESLASVITSRETPWESLESMTASGSITWESLAGLVGTAVVPWESTRPLVISTLGAAWEALAGVLANRSIPWEADGTTIPEMIRIINPAILSARVAAAAMEMSRVLSVEDL